MEKNSTKYNYVFNQSKLDKTFYKTTSEDCRTKVPQEKASSFPYSAIGLLKVEYPHQIISYRTGFLISENTVLYPLNKTTGENNVFHLYEDKGKILELENGDVIVTGIKSSYGQSGAGLFFCKDNKYYVIGVHVASSFDDELFYATMINEKRFNQIQAWIQENNN